MEIPAYYEFGCRVHIVAGKNTLEQIPSLLSDMGASAPMLLTDKGVAAAGLPRILIQALSESKLSAQDASGSEASGPQAPIALAAMDDDIPPDSDLKTVNRLADLYREKKCDALIALGGGSVLDTAKGVNILVSENAGDLMAFTGAGALKKPLRPLIAVPTTAGTGSEVTLVAVIADPEQKRKMAFTSPFLQPDAAVIDPRMTLTLPPHITAATAMDALAHAVESTVMLAKNPLSDAHAYEAMTLIRDNLLTVVDTPNHVQGRLALATAATLAGVAFSNSMVGMVHAIGHSVGSVCHVPHGSCMAILLPYGLEYNLHKVEDRIADLLIPLAGPDAFATTPEPDRARAVIQWIRTFNQTLHQATKGAHATHFKQIKDKNGSPMVPKEKLPEIARTALGDAAIFYNPEDMDYPDLLMVLEAAWHGAPLDLGQIKKG